MKAMIKNIALIIALAISCAVFAGCSSGSHGALEFTDTATGAVFAVRAAGENETEDEFAALCREALDRVRDIEGAIDKTLVSSDVYRFNASESGVEDAGITFQCVVSAGLYAAELTDGAYDPAIGTLTDLWSRARTAGAPSDARIDFALEHSGQARVGVSGASVTKADDKLALDLDGIGRGYALQKATEYVSNSALDYGSVMLADAVGLFGVPDGGSFSVVEHDHLGRAFATLHVKSGYILRATGNPDPATGVSDVIDPVTGRPVETDLRCVIVCSPSGALSDAISTALLTLDADRALDLWRRCAFDFDAILVTDTIVYATGRLAESGAVEITEQSYKLIRFTEKKIAE